MRNQTTIRGNFLNQPENHDHAASRSYSVRLKSFLSLLLLGAFAFPFSIKAAAVEGSVRVIKVEGATVEVMANGSPIQIQTGTILKQGSQIKTGKDGVVDLMFDNGAVLEITPNTEFLIKNFEREAFDPTGVDYKTMQGEPTRSKTILKVNFGAVLAGVKKLKSTSEFNVSTPVGSAGIRGTSFFVHFDSKKRGGAIVGVTDGKVEVLTSSGAILPIRAGDAYGISNNKEGATIKRNPAGASELMAKTRGIDRKIRSAASAKSFEGASAKPAGIWPFFTRGDKKSQPSEASKIIPKPSTTRRDPYKATPSSFPAVTKKNNPESNLKSTHSDPLPPVEISKPTDRPTSNFSDTESTQDFFSGAGDAPVGETVVGSVFNPGFRPASPPTQAAGGNSNSGK